MFRTVRKKDFTAPLSSPECLQTSVAVCLLKENYVKFFKMEPPKKLSSFDGFVKALALKETAFRSMLRLDL